MCKNTLLKIAAPILLLIVLSPMIIATHQTKAYAIGPTCIGPNRINVKGYVIGITGNTIGTACLCWLFNVKCGYIVNAHLCYRVHPSSGVRGCGKLVAVCVNSHCLRAYLYVTFHNIFGQSICGYEFNNIHLIAPNCALVCYGFIFVRLTSLCSIHHWAYTSLPASVNYTFTILPPPVPIL